MSDPVTDYNYIEDAKVSVSIKKTNANECTLRDIFLFEILKRFSTFYSGYRSADTQRCFNVDSTLIWSRRCSTNIQPNLPGSLGLTVNVESTLTVVWIYSG